MVPATDIIKTCYIGPPIVETNTTANATEETEAAASGSRRKRQVDEEDVERVEGVSMLIPREKMVGVLPQGIKIDR